MMRAVERAVEVGSFCGFPAFVQLRWLFGEPAQKPSQFRRLKDEAMTTAMSCRPAAGTSRRP